MTGETANKVGWRTSLAYGIGAIATSAESVPITSFLMLYYNQVIGLPAIAVSTVLMASLILDAVFDPLIGQMSDNCRSRLGRRLPFMYMSAFPMALFFILLWLPPTGWSHLALTAYLAVCVICVRFFDTFFYLPHVALVPELSSDYNERTTLFTVRYLFEALGGIVVGLLAYLGFMRERADGTGGLLSAEGYPAFAWFTGVIIFLCILACTTGLHRRLASTPALVRARPKIKFREILQTINSRSFYSLLGTGFFISIGSGIGSTLSTYWTLYVYQFTQAEISLMMAPVFLGTMATGIAPIIGARLGKRNAAILLSWIYILAASAPLLARVLHLLPAKSPALFGLVMIQTAIAPAAITMVLIMLSSMISDLVEDAEVRTGRRSEGLLLAANSLVRKATMGLGTLGAGVILTLSAFPKGAERTEVAESVLINMVIFYVSTTIVLFIATTLSLLCYRYNRADHEKNLDKLSARVALANSDGSDPAPNLIK